MMEEKVNSEPSTDTNERPTGQPDNSAADPNVAEAAAAAAEATDERPALEASDTKAPVDGHSDVSSADSEAQSRAEAAEWRDKFTRLYSEFENYRRRTAREKADLIETASERVIKEILPVLDDAGRAEQAIARAEDKQAAADAVGIVFGKLRKTLEKQGLKPMEAKGETFDPDLHEAVTQIPAPTEELKGKVVDEIEQGYYLGSKIIRFAKVVTGS